MDKKSLLCCLAGLLLGVVATLAWVNRYYVAVPAGTKVCYKLDKWTGNITFIYGDTQKAILNK